MNILTPLTAMKTRKLRLFGIITIMTVMMAALVLNTATVNAADYVYDTTEYSYTHYTAADDGTVTTETKTIKFDNSITQESFANGSSFKNPFEASQSYYLAEDITLSNQVELTEGVYNIDLNGHSITWINCSETTTMSISSSGTVNIFDTQGDKGKLTGEAHISVNASGCNLNMYGGLICDNEIVTGGMGGAVNVSGGIFNMYGGKISDNKPMQENGYGANGGGVCCIWNGTFNMYDGEISGNTSAGYGGCGIYNGTDGTFNMHDGKISGNKTTTGDGSKDGAGVHNSGTFNMYDGEISGNTAAGRSGGVYNANGTFYMRGGEISGNTSANGGAGVYVQGNTLTISGSPIIYNNKMDSGYNSDVCFYTYRNCIKIDGAITEGAKIGFHLDGGGKTHGYANTSGLGANCSDPEEVMKKYFEANIVSDDEVGLALMDVEGKKELTIIPVAHAWEVACEKTGEDGIYQCNINCKGTAGGCISDCPYTEKIGFTFDASKCGGTFTAAPCEAATINVNND